MVISSRCLEFIAPQLFRYKFYGNEAGAALALPPGKQKIQFSCHMTFLKVEGPLGEGNQHKLSN